MKQLCKTKWCRFIIQLYTAENYTTPQWQNFKISNQKSSGLIYLVCSYLVSHFHLFFNQFLFLFSNPHKTEFTVLYCSYTILYCANLTYLFFISKALVHFFLTFLIRLIVLCPTINKDICLCTNEEVCRHKIFYILYWIYWNQTIIRCQNLYRH